MPTLQASLKWINRPRSEQNTDAGLVSMSYKVYAMRSLIQDVPPVPHFPFGRCSEAEYGDDMRRERDELIVHIFEYEAEDEADRKIVPAYQSLKVMTAGRVIPGADAHTSPQRPSGGVFD